MGREASVSPALSKRNRLNPFRSRTNVEGRIIMTMQGSSARKAEHLTPPIDGDFYRVADLLDAKERVVAQRVRGFMEAEVAPIIEDYWARDKFPFEIIPKIAGIGIGGIGYEGYGAAGGSMLLNGFVAMELARIDSSIATFWGVHTGSPLARFTCAATRAEAALASGNDAVRKDRLIRPKATPKNSRFGICDFTGIGCLADSRVRGETNHPCASGLTRFGLRWTSAAGG